MDRRLVNTPITLGIVTEAAGVPADPSPASATVTITRADGTAIVTAAAATHGANGSGEFSYTLPAVDNDRLDVLTAVWTSSLGTLTTVTEIVGAFLFTTRELRAFDSDLADTTLYPYAKVIDARNFAEQTLEDLCGVAFAPRYSIKDVSGDGSTFITVRSHVSAVRSLTVDGAAVSAATLDALRVDRDGTVYSPGVFTTGFANYRIGYEHGHTTVPERVKVAALILAKHYLLNNPIDDRATSLSTEDGTFALVTPGLGGAPTQFPEVNAVVKAYGQHIGSV